MRRSVARDENAGGERVYAALESRGRREAAREPIIVFTARVYAS